MHVKLILYIYDKTNAKPNLYLHLYLIHLLEQNKTNTKSNKQKLALNVFLFKEMLSFFVLIYLQAQC